MTDEEITIEDLREIDHMSVQILEDLKRNKTSISEEEFLSGFELFFTTILSNGEEVELCQGGKTKRVNYQNLDGYINLSF